MGVTHLWQILQPVSKPLDINDLKNKTLAVDLSIWICENSGIQFSSGGGGGGGGSTICQKPHLRTLFFRCKNLLELGCKLIFVREGNVIDLKQQTMEKRVNSRFGGGGGGVVSGSTNLPNVKSKAKTVTRSHFDVVVDECCELLDYMGITVIRSPCGEAEKACAYLNLIGKCDAVISEDSDVFLYGAQVVYRNFYIDKKSEIKIEEYTMRDIEAKLHYTREMLVVLALILGCDYDTKGIPGIGKETACKFLNEHIEYNNKNNKNNILNRIRKWSNENFKGNGLKNEDKLRRAVCTNTSSEKFPNEKIIDEYLNVSEQAKDLLNMNFYCNNEKWRRPHMMKLQIFTEYKLQWSFDYTVEKLVPLIILYESSNDDERTIHPIEVTKMRRHNFNEYYEVKWHKMHDVRNVYNDKDLSELDSYLTLEKPEFFTIFYSNLVDEFNDKMSMKKQKKTKPKKTKAKEKSEFDEDVDQLSTQLINDLNTNEKDENTEEPQKQIIKKKAKKQKQKSEFDEDSIEQTSSQVAVLNKNVDEDQPISKKKSKKSKDNKYVEVDSELFSNILIEQQRHYEVTERNIIKMNVKKTKKNKEETVEPAAVTIERPNTKAQSKFTNVVDVDNDDSIIILDETETTRTTTTTTTTQYSVQLNNKKHNGTIILEESDEDEHQDNKHNNVEDDDLQSILSGLNNIHIKAEISSTKNEINNETASSSPLPFSMRMKKIFHQKTSIFET